MNITDFLIKNNNNIEIEKEVIISDRFKDEEGNLLPFKIKPIKINKLQEIHYKNEKLNKEDSNYDMIAYCTIEPNFKSVELQKAYNVLNEKDLINEILNIGEFEKLLKEITTLSGFNRDFNEFVNQAKKQ